LGWGFKSLFATIFHGQILSSGLETGRHYQMKRLLIETITATLMVGDWIETIKWK